MLGVMVGEGEEVRREKGNNGRGEREGYNSWV